MSVNTLEGLLWQARERPSSKRESGNKMAQKCIHNARRIFRCSLDRTKSSDRIGQRKSAIFNNNNICFPRNVQIEHFWAQEGELSSSFGVHFNFAVIAVFLPLFMKRTTFGHSLNASALIEQEMYFLTLSLSTLLESAHNDERLLKRPPYCMPWWLLSIVLAALT